MLAAAPIRVPFHHILLSAGPIKVDTRQTRLPIATVGPTTSGVGGNGLSSLCAQTLGQLTSKVPEFCFNVQPRTACTRSEPDPPTFAKYALRVSNASGALCDSTAFYTQERSPSLGIILDRRALCFVISGARWRKSIQEISLAREDGND